MFCSYVEGYAHKKMVMQEMAIYTGYFASYYVGSKRPKSPEVLVKNARKSLEAKQKAHAGAIPKPDVELFQRREQARVANNRKRM